MIHLKLFLSFFKIGLFSIGGGYAGIQIIKDEIIGNGWLSAEKFADIVCIAEMTPGPIGINSATFVGLNIAGISGAITASLSFVLPSAIIVGILAFLYGKYKGLRLIDSILGSIKPCIIALILSAGLSLLSVAVSAKPSSPAPILGIDIIMLGIFLLSLFLLRRCKRLSPILIMLLSGLLSLALKAIF